MRGWLVVLALAVVAVPRSTAAAPSQTIIRKTERALVDQFRCKQEPDVAKAVNAMLRNKLIRYEKGDDGEYLFSPTVPLTFLGFRIRHFTAFDQYRAFRRAPGTKDGEGTPLHSIQIDVVAQASRLQSRARRAGMVESWTSKEHPGLEIDDEPSYLAPKSRGPIAKIRCVAWWR